MMKVLIFATWLSRGVSVPSGHLRIVVTSSPGLSAVDIVGGTRRIVEQGREGNPEVFVGGMG